MEFSPDSSSATSPQRAQRSVCVVWEPVRVDTDRYGSNRHLPDDWHASSVHQRSHRSAEDARRLACEAPFLLKMTIALVAVVLWFIIGLSLSAWSWAGHSCLSALFKVWSRPFISPSSPSRRWAMGKRPMRQLNPICRCTSCRIPRTHQLRVRASAHTDCSSQLCV